MAITSAICTSFKVGLLTGLHDFTNSTGNTNKLALIKDSPSGTYGAGTTNYSDVTGNSDEASGSGYSAGGATLTNVTPTSSSTTAYIDFADVTFSSASVSADGCIIYDTDASNAAIAVFDFGGTVTSSGADFVVQFPTADASDAILRLA